MSSGGYLYRAIDAAIESWARRAVSTFTPFIRIEKAIFSLEPFGPLGADALLARVTAEPDPS